MKTYLALFTCSENSKNHLAWKSLSPEEQKTRSHHGTIAFQKWRDQYQKKIIFQGGSLSKMTSVVDSKGIREIPSQMGAFFVVEANSLSEATKMFLNHPHFSLFPGDGIEILERI